MSESTFDFSGRVVIVTGANGNLGSAVARAYAEAGARLVLVGRRQERVAEALPELAGRDTVWLAPSTDLTDEVAVLRLTNSLALELKHKGINVNCVMPGTIDTPDNRSAMPTADHSRWVAPESIARVFLFLASDAAQALHGVHIPVYGLS